MENVLIAGLIAYGSLVTWCCIRQAFELQDNWEIRGRLVEERDDYHMRCDQWRKENLAYEAEHKKLHERLRKLACIASFKE